MVLWHCRHDADGAVDGAERRNDHAHSKPSRHPCCRPTWNKGRIVGQNRSLLPKHVWAVRVRLCKIAVGVDADTADEEIHQLRIHCKKHGKAIDTMKLSQKKRLMKTQIAFASDIQRMRVHRAPVMATAAICAAAQSCQAPHDEVVDRIGN